MVKNNKNKTNLILTEEHANEGVWRLDRKVFSRFSITTLGNSKSTYAYSWQSLTVSIFFKTTAKILVNSKVMVY